MNVNDIINLYMYVLSFPCFPIWCWHCSLLRPGYLLPAVVWNTRFPCDSKRFWRNEQSNCLHMLIYIYIVRCRFCWFYTPSISEGKNEHYDFISQHFKSLNMCLDKIITHRRRFPEIGTPPNYPFIAELFLINHPDIGVSPFMETPYRMLPRSSVRWFINHINYFVISVGGSHKHEANELSTGGPILYE